MDTLGKKTSLNPNAIPDTPWEIILVDLIGPLSKSKGKNAIMVVVNHFSKMIQLFLVSTEITSQGIANVTIFLLFHHILLVSFNTSRHYWRGLRPSNDSYLVITGPTSFFLSHL